jgi:drug/metabolite transporter (DMT)-like permease
MSQSVSTVPTQTPSRVYIVLAIGVLAASMAAIFIRHAQGEGLPSLLIAAGRLTLSALLLTPFALRLHLPEIKGLSRIDLLMASASGLLLALHFATWIASLEYTTVLVSVVFVATSPLWVALLEFVFLRVRLRQLVIVGLLVAVAGGVIIGISGDGTADQGSNPLLGSALALAGAVALALYLVIGRRLRVKLPLLPYIWLVYGCAAIFLILMVVASGTPVTGFPTSGYLMIVLLALFPQLIGHTSFNYALRYVPATFVSIATQMEPVASAIAAFLVLREVPTSGQIFGSAAIILGVALATLGQRKE